LETALDSIGVHAVTGKTKRRLFGALLLLVMLIAIGMLASGCVSGLVPIGWSGGTVDDGTLFVGTQEGKLAAVGLTDDSLRFAPEKLKATSQTGLFGCSPVTGGGCSGGSSGVAIYGSPVVYGDRVYIAGYNGKVYSYLKDSLQLDEAYPEQDNRDPIVGGVTIYKDTVYFGCSDGKVYALDAENLLEQWTYETEDKIWATPTVIDDTVYIGSFDKKLYALNASDGTKKWEFTSEGAIVARALVRDGTVYVGSFDRTFYALNASNGSVKWKLSGENWFWAEPVLHDGKIFAGCLDNKVYVVNAGTGSRITELDLEGPLSSSPVIIGDTAVFATRAGVIYTIDTASHGLRKLADFEKDVNGPLTAYEDIVVIHTQEKTLERVNITNGAVLMSIALGSKD
jgi:outer membrane protein assembly factor BamB